MNDRLMALVDNETLVHLTVEISSHHELISIFNFPHCIVVNDDSTGLYEVYGEDFMLKFMPDQASIRDQHLTVRYDIGYRLEFAKFSHSSMA